MQLNTENSRMKCDDCNQDFDNLEIRNCPYDEDINDTKVEVLICDDCYHERCMDI